MSFASEKLQVIFFSSSNANMRTPRSWGMLALLLFMSHETAVNPSQYIGKHSFIMVLAVRDNKRGK